MTRIELSGVSNRQEFLQFLDVEIENLLTKQQMPGWNLWGIIGAVSACVWLILGILENLKGETDLSRVLLLLIIFFIAAELINNIVHTLERNSEHRSGTERFKTGINYFGQSRKTILITAMIYLALLFLSISTSFTFNLGYYIGIASFYFAILLLLMFLFFLISFVPFPFPVNSEPSWKSKLIPILIFTLVPAVALYGFLGVVLSNSSFFLIDEWRLAILSYALTYLLLKLPRQDGNSEEVAFLIQIRRAIIFNQLDVKSAVKEVEILFLGAKLNDMFREAVFRSLRLLEKCTKEYIKINSTYDFILLLISRKFINITDEEIEALNALTPIDLSMGSVTDSFDLFTKGTGIFGGQITWIKAMSGRTNSELDNIEYKIAEAEKTFRKEMCISKERRREIKESMSRWRNEVEPGEYTDSQKTQVLKAMKICLQVL